MGLVFNVGERDAIFDVKEMNSCVAVILRNGITAVYDGTTGRQTGEAQQIERISPVSEQYLERKEAQASRLIDDELYVLVHVETITSDKNVGKPPLSEFVLTKVNGSGHYTEVGSCKLSHDFLMPISATIDSPRSFCVVNQNQAPVGFVQGGKHSFTVQHFSLQTPQEAFLARLD